MPTWSHGSHDFNCRSSQLSFSEQLYIDEIASERQTEQSKNVRNDVDYEASGLEGVGVELHPRLAITGQAGEDEQDSTDNREYAKPGGDAGSGGGAAFEMHEFAKGD